MAERSAALRRAVDGVSDEVTQTRRRLHRHPELSHQEHHTAELVAQRSQQLGYTVRTGVGGTGVVADLDSGRPGATVMLRADMDALPITERGDQRPVTSSVSGVMHACGHDGHVAMLLGAAAVLADLRATWSGRVRLCFQPAEEVAAGAAPMIRDGADQGVDAVLGIHLWAPLQVGMVAVTAGVIFGSADEFSIVVRGRGGHGGMPHTAVDPLPAAASIITALQTVVSRETSPFSPAVITVGRIDGGSAFNVIAEEVHMRGTVRALLSDERERLLQRAGEIATAVASAHRCQAQFERLAGCPPVVNDVDMAELVRVAVRETTGEEALAAAQPITVGDDVALFLERAPGCYFLVGAGDVARHPVAPHHHPEFDIDERCLPIGVQTLAGATLLRLAAQP